MITNRQILTIMETKEDYLRKISYNRKRIVFCDEIGDNDKKEELLKHDKILCTEYEQWLDSEAL